jgi:hypothetical protein
LLRGEQFGYRDATHYYYPLYQKVQQEWSAGRWPLWEPEENGGMPLLGNPTAAVLYPGKIIFAMVPYPLAARLYVVGHTLLAYATMFALLRSWRTSAVAAALGAASYAFGAPVLFQYCNVIYLVGAAWAPLGLLAADRWIRLGQRPALLGLTAVLALETLGGDPETAYLTTLCALGYAVWFHRRRHPELDAGAAPASHVQTWRRALLWSLLLLTWVAVSLAAACWAPTVRPPLASDRPPAALPWMPWIGPGVAAAWTAVVLVLLRQAWRSRRRGDRPRLLPTLAGLTASAVLAAAISAAQLFPVTEFAVGTARALDHGPHEIFSFSLEPARLAELVWPNVYGSVLSGNSSWQSAMQLGNKPAKIWSPSLYISAFTFVFSLSVLGLRGSGKPPSHVWMSAVAVVSLAASFGEYAGPIWWARLAPGAAAVLGDPDPAGIMGIRPDGKLRDGDGSPYWAMATFLPGFKVFRFPSKLLTWTTLALAALAAQGLDALGAGDRRIRRRVAGYSAALLGLTIVALVVATAGRESFIARLEGRTQDSYGPIAARAAFSDLCCGLVHGGLILTAALGLAIRKARPGPVSFALVLVAVTVDLALANARHVVTIPQRLFEAAPKALEIIEADERANPMPGPRRIHRLPSWEPVGWTKTSSEDREREFVAWERNTLYPKYGVPFGVEYTLSPGAAELSDYTVFFDAFLRELEPETARTLHFAAGHDVVVHRRRAFDMWNTRYFILPYAPGKWSSPQRGFASFLHRTEPVFPAPGAFTGAGGRGTQRDWVASIDFQVRRNLDCFPRAWVVHDARALNQADDRGRGAAATWLDEILFSEDDRWRDPSRVVVDPRSTVWIEPENHAELAPFVAGGKPTATESVCVISHEADRVELKASLDRPGIVVLSDVYYSGWRLSIDDKPAPMYRANRMMRAAAVDAGDHCLVFAYRPQSFRAGLIVSYVGLAASALLACPWTRHSNHDRACMAPLVARSARIRPMPAPSQSTQ